MPREPAWFVDLFSAPAQLLAVAPLEIGSAGRFVTEPHSQLSTRRNLLEPVIASCLVGPLGHSRSTRIRVPSSGSSYVHFNLMVARRLLDIVLTLA